MFLSKNFENFFKNSNGTPFDFSPKMTKFSLKMTNIFHFLIKIQHFFAKIVIFGIKQRFPKKIFACGADFLF
jgi:hypothetical protein